MPLFAVLRAEALLVDDALAPFARGEVRACLPLCYIQREVRRVKRLIAVGLRVKEREGNRGDCYLAHSPRDGEVFNDLLSLDIAWEYLLLVGLFRIVNLEGLRELNQRSFR